jgi:spore maturation protein CgeB
MNSFEHNCALLAAAQPDLIAAVRAAGGGLLELSMARNGMPTAKRSGRWIHSAYDPAREAESWAQVQAGSCRPGEIVVVLGTGLLYHLEALRKLLATEVEVALFVANPEELHDAFSARRLEAWARGVAWIFGDAEAAVRQVCRHKRPIRIATYQPAVQGGQESYLAFEQALRRQVAKQAGGQLSVALVGPIYGGSLPVAGYVKRALEDLGHSVQWIDHSLHARSYELMGALRDARHRQLMQSRLAEVLSQWTMAHLAESPPDLVLSLAQAPLTLPVLQHLRKKKFLTAMWFVENYRHLTYWQHMAAGYEFWFVIQKNGCLEALRDAGVRQVHYLPMAADPSVHRPLDLSAEDIKFYGSDLSFVGAGYANRRCLLPQLLGRTWSFKVWGNEWEGASEIRQALQLDGARIDTETCMKVFNASTINLNLHSTTGPGLDPQADFVNPRTFELAACGAFQLVDQRSLLPEVFAADEIVSFRDFCEVQALVPRWLQDSAARTGMAARARARVLGEHTYRHRMVDLLGQIGVSQPDRVGAILRGDRQQEALAARSGDLPELQALLAHHAPAQRVELKDLAASIRSKGAGTPLKREELMVLMLDEYRCETRDLL